MLVDKAEAELVYKLDVVVAFDSRGLYTSSFTCAGGQPALISWLHDYRFLIKLMMLLSYCHHIPDRALLQDLFFD